MVDEGQPVPRSVALKEPPVSPERRSVEGEYARCIKVLNRTGILSILPQSETLGVLGIDGQEYGVPTLEQVGDILDHNRELTTRKKEQGFTRLQLTPFAMPLATLTERVGKTIIKHATDGKIFQAKHNPSDPDVAMEVDTEQPIWTWDGLVGADINGSLVYFPSSFDSSGRGLSKQNVLRSRDVCAIPGWSVGLIENTPFLPQAGRGETIGGRAQLETNKTPQQYLAALKGKPYKGETGFAPEDFLIKFATYLEETNQVSHDWDDYSAAWLTGSFQKNEAYVPTARWRRGYRQVGVGTIHPGHRFSGWGAPSTVRLT